MRISGGHGGWCRGSIEGGEQRSEQVGARGFDGGNDSVEFRACHLEGVEQAAGTFGADVVGGDALHDLPDGIEDGTATIQGREIDRRLLEAAAAARRDDTVARVEVAKGRAAQGGRLALESIGLDEATFRHRLHFCSYPPGAPPFVFLHKMLVHQGFAWANTAKSMDC